MIKRITTLILLLITIGLTASQQESFEFGKRMYRDGFYQEALLVFERITNVAPQSPESEESLYLLGEIYRMQDKFLEAENHYRRFYEAYQVSPFRENALYYWAFSTYKQEKYSLAIELFNGFIEAYPNSTNKANSYYYLMNSYHNISAHQSVISQGQRFIREFPNNSLVPDIMYFMALSYVRSDTINDAYNTLDMIIRDYPQSDARWQSVIIKGDIIQKERGIQAAIDHYNEQMNYVIPRLFEEKIQYQLATLYLTSNDYIRAVIPLSLLINKYDRSPQLAEYLFYFSYANTKLMRYQPIVDSYEKTDILDIIDTPLYYDYLIKVAGAFYYLNKFDATDTIINEYLFDVQEDNHVYAVVYWNARLKEQQGRLLDAINSYHQLITNYPSLVEKDEVLMRIGDIYFEQMQMYQTAINYYNQISTSVSFVSKYHWTALYKAALCYELLGDYSLAYNTLQQINLDYIDNEMTKNEIIRRLEILSQFKKVDYETITSKLISSLYQYIDTNDKDNLRDRLITTMLVDMKDAEGVLVLLEQDQTAKATYLRGRANVKLLHRADLEKRTSDRRNYFDQLNNEISSINRQLHPMYVKELEIDRDYIINNYTLIAENLTKAESFVSDYPEASATNRFRFLIGQYYLRDANYAEADQYLSRVVKDRELPLVQYEQALIMMGNYFFDNEEYEQVINYFNKIDSGITINRAEEMYRYAVSLINTGETTHGLNKLEFLVKNSSIFASKSSSIDIITDHYRTLDAYETVVTYMLMYPESERDRDYFVQLSHDYLQIGDRIRSKESLMHITDKDTPVLLNLAELHYQTGDLFMAELTYTEILKNQINKEDRLRAQSGLAHIYFTRENWREAINYYDPVINELGDNINIEQYQYLDLVQISKESVISNYRVQNRPRADNIKQRFQNILRTDNTVLAEIELNESIYQMTVNRSRAERGFSDIIRNHNLPENLRMRAYFWRGVNHLENKKTNEAKADFQNVLRTTDKELLSQAHLKLGTINFSEQQFQQALEHYHIVIQTDMTGNLAYDAAKNYAIVCKTIEDWQQAIEAYEIILERWGDGEEAGETLFNIAYCQFRDRKYLDAIRTFESALPLISDREMKAEAQYWIGESYFSMNQFDNAATEYLKVGYFYPEFVQWNAISELKLAEAYIRQGRYENARGVLNTVIEKYGRDSDWGKQALIYLEQI
ncbi:MAG: tetratricopeptide repeat protein [Candidatus Cloacimonetes bacterium]|nr:tetratricopeptide repeat protein [Candidatus Cloacimonadota bacterium]